MTETTNERGICGEAVPAAFRLPQEADAHLRAALGQMDLLLQTEHCHEALHYLLAMLRHLKAVRRYIV